MNDVVAFVQVEEGVDGARFDLAAGLPRGRCLRTRRQQILVKEFVAAEYHDAGIDEAEPGPHVAGDELQPLRLGELPGREHVREAMALGLGLAGDEYSRAARGHGIEFIADAVDVAAEALHRFHTKVDRGFHRRPRHRRDGDRRELHEVSERMLDGEKSRGVGDALEEELRVFLEVARFDERDPRLRRQVIREEARGLHAPLRGLRVAAKRDIEQRHGFLRLQAPLRTGGEGADRFHFVAKELEPHGVGRVGWEDVADAAAAAELAGILHGVHALVAVLDEPDRERGRIDDFANY